MERESELSFSAYLRFMRRRYRDERFVKLQAISAALLLTGLLISQPGTAALILLGVPPFLALIYPLWRRKMRRDAATALRGDGDDARSGEGAGELRKDRQIGV